MAELREAIKNGHKASIQQGLETEPGTYEEVVLSKIPEAPIYRFHQDARSQGNLEYLIAEDENDLSRGQPISFFYNARRACAAVPYSTASCTVQGS